MSKGTFTLVLQGMPQNLKRQNPLAPQPCFCLMPGPRLIHVQITFGQSWSSMIRLLLRSVI